MLDAFQVYSFIFSCPTELFEKQRQYKQVKFLLKAGMQKIKFYDSNHKLRSNLKTYLLPLWICKIVGKNWYSLCCWSNLNLTDSV